MGFESESLLYVELDRVNYANAFIFNGLVTTARHIASQTRTITVPGGTESAQVSFRVFPARDLAVSHDHTLQKGYERVAVPQLNDVLRVIGHHGQQREPFEIVARVIEILGDQRIVVERIKGKTFQPGMSGSPALNDEGDVIGILVEGVKGAGGQKVILEPATALVA